MLVYKGCELEHWREKFNGNICAQVFLHYNEILSNNSSQNLVFKQNQSNKRKS